MGKCKISSSEHRSSSGHEVESSVLYVNEGTSVFQHVEKNNWFSRSIYD